MTEVTSVRPSSIKEVNALEVFKNWAATDNLAVMACHTTDFNGEVIELAIVDRHGGTLFNERIKPVKEVMADGAREVHGIDLADLMDKQTIEHFWPDIASVMTAHKVIAYSPDFLVKVLKRSLMVLPVEPGKGSQDHSPLIKLANDDTSSVIEAYSFIAGVPSDSGKGFKYVKLLEACQRQGIQVDLSTPPSALYNALLCLEVVNSVAQMSPDQLPHLLQPMPDPFQHDEGEAQQPAPVPVPEDLPRGSRFTDTTSALFYLVSIGWIKRYRPEFFSLPDNSLHFTFQKNEVVPGESKVCVDTLIRAACEFQTLQRSGDWTVTLGFYRLTPEVTQWTAVVWQGRSERGSSVHQRYPGLAIMNALDDAGWLA